MKVGIVSYEDGTDYFWFPTALDADVWRSRLESEVTSGDDDGRPIQEIQIVNLVFPYHSQQVGVENKGIAYRAAWWLVGEPENYLGKMDFAEALMNSIGTRERTKHEDRFGVGQIADTIGRQIRTLATKIRTGEL